MSTLTIEEGIYFTINQCKSAAGPKPLDSGFSQNRMYRALGLFNPSETSEAYFILSNDRDEIWFISNRHLRFAEINKLNLKPYLEVSEPIRSDIRGTMNEVSQIKLHSKVSN